MPTTFRDVLPASLLDAARMSVVASGAYLFSQDDPIHAVYIVKSGQVALRRPLSDGSFVVVQVSGPDELLAEAALFADIYHCDAVATMKSEVIALPKAAMLNLLSQDHTVALAWMLYLSAQIRALRQRLEIRDIRPARSRVCAWLALQDGAEIVLARPLKETARELGLTHEAFYRTLAGLERDGLIQRNRGSIVRMSKNV